jgi:hypothetical protein
VDVPSNHSVERCELKDRTRGLGIRILKVHVEIDIKVVENKYIRYIIKGGNFGVMLKVYRASTTFTH